MASETVRVKPETHAKLRALAEKAGTSMPEIVDRAIEAYRRQKLLDETNQAYARLRDDGEAWADELKERGEWDATLADGLEDE